MSCVEKAVGEYCRRLAIDVNVFPCSVLVRPRQCSYKLPPSEVPMPFTIRPYRRFLSLGSVITVLLVSVGGMVADHNRSPCSLFTQRAEAASTTWSV